MKNSVHCSLLILSLFFFGCTPVHQQQDADMDALLWSTASAEYDVIAQQIFFQAQRQLSVLLQSLETAALEQGSGYKKLPPAVIVDVDDTLLSNGQFHYALLASGKHFDVESWNAWIDQAQAKPIVGALEYTNYAASKGITVFYVSNRDISQIGGTKRNLEQLGFPLDKSKEQLLMLNGKQDWSWDKSTRRAYISQNYRVLQIVGDGLGDFIPSISSMSLLEQRAASGEYLSYWGERWFMLPNPVYGDWENAILKGEEINPSPALDPMRAKYRFIRGGESQGVW